MLSTLPALPHWVVSDWGHPGTTPPLYRPVFRLLFRLKGFGHFPAFPGFGIATPALSNVQTTVCADTHYKGSLGRLGIVYNHLI